MLPTSPRTPKEFNKNIFKIFFLFKERNTIINYIKNQQEHHKKENFQDEVRKKD